MTCSACGRTNPAGARFCAGCGTPLAPRCPACGADTPADARFCIACGAPIASIPAGTGGERKVVTIVFADLAGSTALHERLDAESASTFMDRYYRAMQTAVEAHGGTVTQLLGDGVKAVFGAPRVAEDDALRAVRAAVGMQRGFSELASAHSRVVGDLGLRVAVHTGEVVAKDAAEIIGDPVNVAARLQQEAGVGDVLVGESTRRLVGQLVTLAPFGTFSLKGRAEPVSAYRVVSLERPAGSPAIAFVGREDELLRLLSVYDAAVAERGARLAVILGSPGLGKSRLLDELGRRLGDRARVLTASCNAAGGGTFAPIAAALRGRLRLDGDASGEGLREAIAAAIPGADPERDRVAGGVAALLAGTPASPEETFFVVRRLLAVLAADRPVVLAIDDLQWAEPLLFDLIEHLVQWSRDVPLVVLAAARPELREARSSLATSGGLVAELVTLSGLDAVTATRLAASVIGADALPAAIAGRVLATSEGNPLFVGELVRMLVHDGVLVRDGSRWTAGAEVAALEMPPTIHALLAARIERLRPEERSVLERAAVIGRQFSRAALADLLPPEFADLDARLESLRRSELVEPDTGWLLGEPVLRFHHVLIRDAAYRRLLKHTRAELHGRYADWLEARVGAGALHDETIGWHLEQAHQYLLELGPIDERGRVLGERAARRLAAAGRRALSHDDVARAAGLLSRALAASDAADPARPDLVLDWCEGLLAAGEVGAAAGAVGELGRLAGDSPRLRAWHTCFAGQLAVLTDPRSLRATAGSVAAAAAALASAADTAGEAKAHSVHATALMRLGEIGACEAALDRALAAARQVRDRRRVNAVLAGAPLAALWGPSPVARASGRCLDVVRVLRITQGAPAVEAVALRCQAVLEALRGRSEAARRMIATSRRMVEELGITQGLLETEAFAGLVEVIEGDVAAAERSFRAAYAGFRERGLGIDAARAAALLGRTLVAQGRAAEAEALSHESEALAGDDLQAAITWRRVRAEALAQRGEHAAAIDFARQAVDIAAATDALLHHADARLALSAALRAAGRSEAVDEEQLAISLWEAKGATLLVDRLRRGPGRSDARVPSARGDAADTGRRRVPPSAATEHVGHWDAAVAARDLERLAALANESLEVVHHPTGAVYDRDGMLATMRILFGARDLKITHEPIAALGDRLTLCRSSVIQGEMTAADFPPFGAVENERFALIEVDERGRRRRAEIFAAGHLGDAVPRLYQRHADRLPAGPERDRAAATARSVAALLAPLDLARWATALAPDVEFDDRRTLGLGFARGADALLRGVGSLLDMSEGLTTRHDDVLGLRPDALIVHRTNVGTIRASGGAYERPFFMLFVFGSDGLLARLEQLDADREAEALARFDALAAGPPADGPGNAAWRALQTSERRWRERDWAGVLATYHPAHRMDDRRKLMRLHVAGEDFLANERMLFEETSSRWESSLLATRGDRLALCRVRFTAEVGDSGPMDVEMLDLVEVDAGGRRVALVVFDPDDERAARDELEARHAAGGPGGDAAQRDPVAALARQNAAARAMDRLQAGFEQRDWPAVRALAADGARFEDRRRHARVSGDVDWWLADLRQLAEAEIGPLRYERKLVATAGDRVCVERVLWSGGPEGGRVEIEYLWLAEVDEDGRIVSGVMLDLDDRRAAHREARTRWLARDAAAAAISRPVLEIARGFNEHDRDRIRAALAADVVMWDHRLSGAGELMGAEAYVESLAVTWPTVPDIESDWFPLVLERHGSMGVGGVFGRFEGGAFDVPLLSLAIVSRDLVTRIEVFEIEELDAALARLGELRSGPKG